MLYGCTQRVGCFVETLARFRPDPLVVHALSTIAGPDEGRPSGTLDPTWLANRAVGRAEVGGDFVAIGESTSLAYLNREYPWIAAEFGLPELDGASIRRAEPRALTQRLGRQLYNLSAGSGPRFAGISYLSRLGDDLTNWAIFEQAATIDPVLVERISPSDPDLIAVMEQFDLRWPPGVDPGT